MLNANLQAIIEMPKGTKFKYELSIKEGASILEIDRVLEIPVPFNYGFIPYTLADDGDPLDVFVLGEESMYPISHMDIEVLGVIPAIDNGKKDDKIIACIKNDWATKNKFDFNSYGVYDIYNYLKNYKLGFNAGNFQIKEHAYEIITESQIEFQKKNLHPSLYATITKLED